MTDQAKPDPGTDTPIVPPVVTDDAPSPGSDAASKDGAAGDSGTTTPAGETPAGEQPAKEGEQPAAEKADVTYDLTLPTESVLDPAVVERTVAYAKAQGLSNEQAKAALDLVHQEAGAAVKSALDAWQPGGARHTELVTGWEKDTLADDALGKTEEERQATIHAGKQVLAKYREAHPEQAAGLVAFLETSGYGNQKDVARFLGFLGKQMGEKPMAGGGKVSVGAGDARDFFPNSPGLNP